MLPRLNRCIKDFDRNENTKYPVELLRQGKLAEINGNQMTGVHCTPYKIYSEDSLVLAAGGADFSSAGRVS